MNKLVSLQCLCCLGNNEVHRETEDYINLLKDCFQIEVNVDAENENWGVCALCAALIRSANDFKNQVLACQKLYQKDVTGVTDAIKIDTLVKKEKLKKSKVFNNDLINQSSEAEVIDDLLSPLTPIKQEQDYEDFDFNDEIKGEYLEIGESDEDDKNLALLAIEQLTKKTVKRRGKSLRDGKARKRKKDDIKASPKARSKKIKLIIKPTSLRTITLKPIKNNTTEVQKHRYNIMNLLKYSNAMPFANKTLLGYVCAFCPETYPDPAILRQHIGNKHKHDEIKQTKKKDNKSICVKLDITNLKCMICDQNFEVISCLKSHLINDHSIKFYTDVNDYVLEFKLTTDDVLNCALCNCSYETFKMLLQHMNGHYRNYICNFCDQGFINQTRLKNHLRTHETGDFKCEYCDKVFSTQTKKHCHEKYTHNNGSRYTTNCPHCDMSFTTYYQRNRHMASVHNTAAASYRCNICDRNFLMKAKLTYHIKKIHLMERNHVCSQCGQGFFMKQYLEEHMIKHNGERVFKCTVCSKAYARKKTLREHMRIHNNDRRFRCEVCALAFVQKCSLKSHMLSNHGLTLKNSLVTSAICSRRMDSSDVPIN